ncbi:adenylate/guanylate cyclase domain-containing protein [Archangium lansingense]|uniref:Adenylate/guanylate cyclase domain-containing protein n=1 Tax=Archangium lansingense TaxID=2995310 RepID=A0ABT3ZU21_9BACT|nr:adenylate/guanylate cyclase domain-containing protein [Archangium lansinium]MCY1072898.1 adenylate/guanylate cyclase domain-containing protein [Archangium lansinium]
MTATRTTPESTETGLEELRMLHALNREVDSLIEECIREQYSLAQTFQRILPAVLRELGAQGIAVTTRNEELAEQTFHTGDFGGVFPGPLLTGPHGTRREGDGTVVSQTLDVMGQTVGLIGLYLVGDHTRPEQAQRLERMLDTVAEQLDTVLLLVHSASEKQELILRLNQLLANPVFEAGMDQVVLTLAQRVRVPGFLLVYRDAVRHSVLHYRAYRHGHLEYDSGDKPSAELDTVLREHGAELLRPGEERLKQALGQPRVMEAVLISGHLQSQQLGRILLWSGEEGFSSQTMDLVRVLASTLSQRLVDYNRERTHLSKFFPADTIDELLQVPDYAARYLVGRDEEVGILFADLNGFTRLCEQLESPARIGRFVDRWSERMVELLWRHGGVFDKMVGDCIIGLFGPPFFRDSRRERAEALVRAACDIQRTTAAMSADPEVRTICERVGMPGLGVAVGLNLAPTLCGLFGPNQDYTGFSTGMNQTARLQSLAGFREMLVMEPVKQALEGSQDPVIQSLRYGELTETPVKNVAKPLRHHRLHLPD